MSGDGIGDLPTHLLHGRVVEVQRVRVAQRPFAFPFAFATDLPLPFLATAARAGFAGRATDLAGFADFTAVLAGAATFAGTAAFAGTTAFTGLASFGTGAATMGTAAFTGAGGAAGFAGGGAGGRAGARELVLSGGNGCFRGRPLLRAA